MEGYQTEEQQVAALKEFWQENRWFIIAFIIVFLGILFGSNIWRNHEQRINEKASNLYQEMLVAMQDVDVPTVKKQGELLIKHYSKTPYAALSTMILAKLAIDEEDLSTAIEQLRNIIANGKKTPLWHVAKIKLARLLHAQGQNQQALQELNNPPNGYIPLYEELKGDIYHSLHDFTQAKEAYNKAILHSNGNPVPWLEMKLTSINTAENTLEKGATDDAASKTNG